MGNLCKSKYLTDSELSVGLTDERKLGDDMDKPSDDTFGAVFSNEEFQSTDGIIWQLWTYSLGQWLWAARLVH